MAYGTAAEILEQLDYINDTDDEVVRLEVDNGQVYISKKFKKIDMAMVTAHKSTWTTTDAVSVTNVSSAGVVATSIDGSSPAVSFKCVGTTTDLTVTLVLKGEQ